MKALSKLLLSVSVLALTALPSAVRADDIDEALSDFATAIHDMSADTAMAAGCEKKLNDQGTGSTCSCSASGSGATCICSGSGNQTVCSCTDGQGTTYCYYCGNGSKCECGPTNRSGQPCKTVTRATLGAHSSMEALR